jgi:pyocin large subunit-like protein
MKKMRDGWKIAEGYEVYVENGKILRGVKLDANGGRRTAYPYRQVRSGGWKLETGVSLAAFRAAVRRGTMDLM